MIQICKVSDYQHMSRVAADLIAAQILLKPRCVLGLATGSTPIGTYANLVARYKKGELSFSDVTTVNLDEYKGISAAHEQSYRYFMQENLFSHVDIDPKNTHVPDGMAADAEMQCRAYDALVQALGGADLQLLGIGHNGHIGFNEPCGEFVVPTHVVDLTDSTMQANARFFESREQVPRQALTMGIGTIMSAKKIVVVASGEDKAQAVQGMVKGEVSPAVPASILQLHADVVLVADAGAASML